MAALTQLTSADEQKENVSKTLCSVLQGYESEHSYAMGGHQRPCESCEDKNSVILSLTKKIDVLTKENDLLKKNMSFKSKSKATFSYQIIKTDKKMNFYTGISTVALFNVIFSLLRPYLPKVKYWRGRKTTSLVKRISISQKSLSNKDEFLMVLMRLRLGLMNEDLADRFGISTSSASNIFTTWINLLSKVLGHCMLTWLPKESVQENLPAIFRKAGHAKTRCIIDCTEVFIERPKSLHAQAATWSDYKSHNTFKFLIAISPTGFITFVSSCYGGRASDKFICNDSGFYELLDYGDEVMADRGFQIQEDLMLRYCSLSVPPGARVKSQMTPAECKKTKCIANLRIHVERAINRITTFRILKSPLPICMTFHANEIIRTCSALCNFKTPLIKSRKK